MSQVVQRLDSAIHQISHHPLVHLIAHGCTYLVPVVQRLDSAIHWINPYTLDNSIAFDSTYPVDSDSEPRPDR